MSLLREIQNAWSQVADTDPTLLDETTGNTIAFLLYELARHPDVQSRLRSEIQEALTVAKARGDDDLTMADMDNMKYALSVVKVCGSPFIISNI